MVVEQRRECPETDLGGQSGDDAAADAALGRHADPIDPLSGVVVHSRTGHHRQRAGHGIGCHDLFAGDGVDAAIGKRSGHDRQVPRGHQNGALAEIDVQNVVNVTVNDGIIAQQIGDGAVAVPGCALGGKHGFVDAEIAAGEAAERGADLLERAASLASIDEARACDGA